MLPLQNEVNPDNPREHAAWALVGLPGANTLAPLVLPVEIMEKWSEHLYKCGFRHHPELQEIVYVPPVNSPSWVSGAGGRWVRKGEELTEEELTPRVSELSDQEKRLLFNELKKELGE